MSDVEFETMRAEKRKFGRNNFIEVARKRANRKDEEGQYEFLSISRGYYAADGTERFKKSITVPDDPEIRKFVAEMLTSL